ncbi:MAG TPA: YfiR family protein [Bryobacteraceae bacterium]|nr:YfiR family protein [Bryobacteraceae bacterium]
MPGVRAAGDSDLEARLKAAYIYNFARFVEWPARANRGVLRIGVIGQGDLALPLEQLVRGKTANGRPIEVARVGALTGADCCEILVIEKSEFKHAREIAQSLAGIPVLTVSDEEDGLRDGVMIAFQLFEESVRFQINQEAAEHAGLRISSQLLKVALPGTRKHL